MTVQQVKQDLKSICYYHLHKALIDRAFACSANNKFLNTLQIYNNAIANAPLELHLVYVGLYVDCCTQEALADKLGYTRTYIYMLNRKLVEFFVKELSAKAA